MLKTFFSSQNASNIKYIKSQDKQICLFWLKKGGVIPSEKGARRVGRRLLPFPPSFSLPPQPSHLFNMSVEMMRW